MNRPAAIAVWSGLGAVATVPVALSLASPLLAWREPVYILAGLAGVAGLALLLFQPLLARATLPGLSRRRARRLHRATGAVLIVVVTIHVAGLWITSPPDVIDALTFRSPTPFSLWGVLAMWALAGAGLLAAFRHRIAVPPRFWRTAHVTLALIVVGGTVTHAMLIDGTMEFYSKAALCVAVVLAALVALRI